MQLEATVVPIMFFGSVFAFPLLRRQLIHRNRLELLRAATPSPALLASSAEAQTPTDDAPALALSLPEPHRHYALALLCRLQDAPYARLDARSQYVLRQARLEYLPATLRAYLHLTPAARQRLHAGGQSPEGHLQVQLELIAQGVTEALERDHTAADRMLTQGRFLRHTAHDSAETVREYLQS